MFDKHLDGFAQGLGALLRYFKGDVPVRRLQVLILVARQEPIELKEAARLVRAPQGTVYDDLKALGERTTLGKAGARLVTEVRNEQGGPHTFSLSPRGQQAISTFLIQMKVEMAPNEDEELDRYFREVMSMRV